MERSAAALAPISSAAVNAPDPPTTSRRAARASPRAGADGATPRSRAPDPPVCQPTYHPTCRGAPSTRSSVPGTLRSTDTTSAPLGGQARGRQRQRPAPHGRHRLAEPADHARVASTGRPQAPTGGPARATCDRRPFVRAVCCGCIEPPSWDPSPPRWSARPRKCPAQSAEDHPRRFPIRSLKTARAEPRREQGSLSARTIAPERAHRQPDRSRHEHGRPAARDLTRREGCEPSRLDIGAEQRRVASLTAGSAAVGPADGTPREGCPRDP